MQSFKKPARRVVLVGGITGAALIGAVAVGGAALADGPSAPASSSSSSTSAAAPSAPAAPSGAPSAPAAPSGRSGSTQSAPTPPKHEPHIGGEVVSLSGSTLTVKDHDGFTRTVVLGSSVSITKDGQKADTSALTKGEDVEATGSVDSNGTSLDATKVEVGRPAGPKGGPGDPGRGGHGGPGAQQGAPTPPNGGPAAGQQGSGQGSSNQQGSSAQGSGQQGSAQPSAPTPPSGAPSAPSASQAPQGS